jgi:hypothetical protein
MLKLADLERALVNADAAGDEESARVLAQQIRVYRHRAEMGVVTRGNNAMSLGVSKLIAGGVGAVKGGLQDGFGGIVPGFKAGEAEHNAEIEAAKDIYPKASGLAAGVGLAGSLGAIPMRAIPRGAGLLAQVKAGAKVGAAYGGLEGFAGSDGSIGERVLSGGLGATVGAGAGAAFPPALMIGQSGYRAARGILKPGTSPAASMIVQRMEADNISPRAIIRAMDEGVAEGTPTMPMDLGDNLREFGASVGRQPGPGKKIIKDAVNARQEAQSERLTAFVRRDLGATGSPIETSRKLTEKARADAGPLYDEAYSAPMNISDDLAELVVRRMPPGVVAKAKELARLEGVDPNRLGVDLDDAGQIVLTEVPTMRTLDLMKRGLDDLVDAQKDTFGRLNTQGNALNDLRKTFIAELDKANGAYKAARAAYAGPVAARNALEDGRKAWNKSADEIAEATRNMTPFEREHYALGIRAAMLDEIAKRGDYADKVRALAGTPKKRAAMQELFGGKAEWDRFVASLARERRAAETYAAVGGNSKTAERLAEDAQTTPEGMAAAVGDFALTGNPTSAALATLRAMLRKGADKRAGKLAEVERAQIAAVLSESDPEVVRQLFREVQRQQTVNRVSQRRTTQLVAPGARASTALVAPAER